MALFEKNFNYKNDFKIWLSAQVKPSFMYEFDVIYDEIEKYCKKLNVINKPLFETSNYLIIKRVKTIIESNKMYRYMHKKNITKYITAVNYLYKYSKNVFENTDNSNNSDLLKADETNYKNLKKDLEELLLRESTSNANGISDIYLHANMLLKYKDITLGEINKILCESDWAKSKKGTWIHEQVESKFDKPKSDEQFLDNPSEEEIVLQKKYPIIYKSIKKSLIKLSSRCHTVSVQDIYLDIKKISRITDIEMILSKVSWAKRVNEKYAYCFANDTIEKATIDLIADVTTIKPIKFYYFDEEHENIISWIDLYEKLLNCLYADYPHILNTGTGLINDSNGHIESITNIKEIKDKCLTIESDTNNLTIINKIKYILDLCRVDYENLIIYYKKYNKKLPKDSKLININSRDELRSIKSVNEKYVTILMKRFAKGYRLGSGIDIKKFKRYYFEIYGCELIEDDSVITDSLRYCGIIHEGKLFLPDMMLSTDIREKLLAYISDEFKKGKNVLYYEALFCTFSEQFLDYYIYNAEMLKSYLTYYSRGRYYIYSNFISKDENIVARPYDELKEYLMNSGTPINADMICKALSHIPSKKIMQILGMNAEFINNGKSHYFHVNIINFSENEINNIANLISELIQDKEFISGNELISAISVKYQYIIDNNPNISSLGMRDVIKYYLQHQFSFTGNVISYKDKCMSMANVFANFAKSKTSFDIAELVKLADEMNTNIYFEDVYNNALRISQSGFVSKEQAQFRIYETDLVIERFCTGDYISIKTIDEFGSFPDAGFQWNSYLLAHYVYSYSKRYKLLTAGFNRNSSVGAIVNRNSQIESFDDFLVVALSEGNCKLKKEEALSFLVEQGYLARRSYSNIEEVLIQANAQRNTKGID